VRGAVEGSHGRLAEAAAGGGALFIEHDARRLITVQLVGPDVVDIGPDDIDELARLVLGRALDAFFGRADAAELAGDLLGRGGVDAEDEIADGRQDQHPDPAAGDRPAAHAAPVLDAAAAPSALPLHARRPSV